MDNCREEGYDGAWVMAGSKKEFQSESLMGLFFPKAFGSQLMCHE